MAISSHFVFETPSWQTQTDFQLELDCGPLTLAIVANDVGQVKHILERHPAIIQDERNILGQTPLHAAVVYPECLQLQLQYADDGLLNATDQEGFSPVHYALKLSVPNCYVQNGTMSCDCDCPCAIAPVQSLLKC